MRDVLTALGICILTGWTLAPAAEAQIGHDLEDRPAEPVTHREVPDDPPMPAPPQPPGAERGRLVIEGPYPSIQANVDEFGENIWGDAANEPSIAIDPTDPNRIVIGWRQFDTVESNFRQAGWGYSHDGGQTWTFPGSLTPGVFGSDPVLDSDIDGGFYYASINFDEMRLFRSFDGGVTWDGPTQVIAGFHDKEWMVIDRTGGIGTGHIYLAWTDWAHFTRSTDGGSTFMPPIPTPLNSTLWSTMSIGPDGELFLADRFFAVTRSSDAQNPDATPTFDFVSQANLGGSIRFGGGPNPGGLLGQLSVATDHSNGPSRGNVYLLASVGPFEGDPLDVMFARSRDGGQNWGAPIRVNDDPPGPGAWQWFGTMSVAPNGRIDVVWNDTRRNGEPHLSELYYAFSTDAGDTWSQNVPISPVFNSYEGWPKQNKLGDYYHMISDEVAANLAYAATFNGEQDVYFVRIGDCNENGVHDGADIADGASEDCNENGIPDECDPGYMDIELLVSLLLDDDPNPSLACMFDADGNGVLNGNDIQPFVDALLAP